MYATTQDGKITREGKTATGQWIEVTYGFTGTYFTVTASEWTNKAVARRHPNHPNGVGCMHDEILSVFPDLADIVALHLSDANGAPMHSVENGVYFYQESSSFEKFARHVRFEKFARHVRLPQSEIPTGMNREEVVAFIDSQRARWQAEADAVRSKYGI